jgi:hypothetical protein
MINVFSVAVCNMAYGPDTDELLRRLSTIVEGKLDLSYLNIHRLPKLPVDLRPMNILNRH